MFNEASGQAVRAYRAYEGSEWKMDCFKEALEYLFRTALENNGLKGKVIVTKIEPKEQKEEKAG
ncbi:MAG: hypothetical protein SPE18_10320 [Candidatus Limivicinus sp.]|nr:hypothetical protein [Candidatus Limivicinus sp.]